MNQLTLGSLFDGIGGFPLAGIKPVWASEIEPFPVRVTQKRLPDMKHYGDVSKLNGGDLEPVDIITFGSHVRICPSPASAADWTAHVPDCSVKRSESSQK